MIAGVKSLNNNLSNKENSLNDFIFYYFSQLLKAETRHSFKKVFTIIIFTIPEAPLMKREIHTLI